MMNVADIILSAGSENAPAIFCKGRVISYRELRGAVARIACFLRSRQHLKGSRIGIFSENNPFFIAAYLGVIKAGLVAVPFQTETPPETFDRIVSDAGIKLLFVSSRFFARVHPWAEKCGAKALKEDAVDNASQDEPNAFSFPEIHPSEDLAALMFTSGSTGSPKGVMVTHRNIECNTRDIISYLGLSSEDRAMVVLPFHYCFGASLLHTLLMAGGSVVLNNDFKLYPEVMLREMQERKCTGLAGVPSTYQLLLRKSRFREFSFPQLKWFQQAGGKLPNPFICEIRNSFPGVQYFLMYGQTEATARLSYLPPERLNDKLGSIGQGLPSTRLEVLKPDGISVVPGSDETGEIVAAGDNITMGYWNDPAETGKFFRNGKLHTGDIARIDQDGFIFVVERERDLIKSGGNRVSAKEVEDVIAELTDVVEVAVIGVPHELMGEAIKAFVVLRPQAMLVPDDIREYCRKKLPSFKTPEEVILLKAMPQNSSGKILKPKLRELALNTGASPAPAELLGSKLVPAVN